MGINIHNAQFLVSAARRADFPHDALPQVAFAGRSNVGKSSVINCILNRGNFARVGNAPGKTTHINYFLIDGKLYLVDLPGYGYAEVSAEERARWGRLIDQWFRDTSLLTVGILVVDARHRPTEDDFVMAECFRQLEKPFAVVANKLDKLKKSDIVPNLDQIRTTLRLDDEVEVVPFSAANRTGRERLLSLITKEAFP